MFRIDGIRKRSFQRFRSQGIRASETSVEDVLKLLKILRDFEWCLKDASSPNSASAGERTAGRFCCNRHYLKAMGCRKGSRTHEAAGQNNSSLTSLPAAARRTGRSGGVLNDQRRKAAKEQDRRPQSWGTELLNRPKGRHAKLSPDPPGEGTERNRNLRSVKITVAWRNPDASATLLLRSRCAVSALPRLCGFPFTRLVPSTV
jgi:hypothetical protein